MIQVKKVYEEAEKKSGAHRTLTPKTRLIRVVLGGIVIIASVYWHSWWWLLGTLFILGAVFNHCPVECYIRSRFVK